MGNVSVYAGNQFPISELFSSPLTPSFMFLANCLSKNCVNYLNSIQNSHFPPSLFVNVRFPFHKAQSTPRLSFDTRSNLGTHVPLPLVIFAFIFRIKIVYLDSEHYGIITDIAAIFKVTDTDTCLFVRISCTVLYANSEC